MEMIEKLKAKIDTLSFIIDEINRELEEMGEITAMNATEYQYLLNRRNINYEKIRLIEYEIDIFNSKS